MYKTIIKDLEMYLNVSPLSDETRTRYKYCIIKFLKFVEETKRNINLRTVTEYLNMLGEEKKLTIGTINDYRTTIKYLFEVVIDEGWNDRKVPRLKGYKPLPVVLSIKEVKRLFKYTKDDLYLAIFTTMYSSGLRISEATRLKFKDIDSDRKTIYIDKPKNGNARYAYLSMKNTKQLRKYYKRYWKNKFSKYNKNDYIFCTYRKDVPITNKSVRKELKRAAQRAGIEKELTPHSLKHSVAVHMLESGVGLVTIQRFLGHKSILSTCIYLQLANIKKLDFKNPFDNEF
jgi:site-specific recombinase XerD